MLTAPPAAPPSLVSEEIPQAPPTAGGFSTAGLLGIAAAVAVGGWLLFGRKKPQAA
jgi:hypothetical protein